MNHSTPTSRSDSGSGQDHENHHPPNQQNGHHHHPPYYQRVDDPIKGRHLVATQTLTKGQLIFVDRPLLAFQSIQNLHYNRYICYNCKAFVNTPANMLSWRCRSTTTTANVITDESETQPHTTSDQTSNAVTTVTEREPYGCVPCRHSCGYVYCSTSCEIECWSKHHQYLCTGDLESDTHPIVQYKQYAIETNEVLLLIAEWWISQHSRLICSSSSGTSGNIDNDEPPNRNDTYTDFIMNPWWDVVTSDMIQDANEPSAGYINGEVITIHDQLKVVCTTAAELLNSALGYPTTKVDGIVDDNNNNHQHLQPHHAIPKITALDIACRIGAMEQNAMGIRQRSPLCAPSLLTDTQFRHKYHEELVQCLQETGLIGNNNDNGCNDDDNNDDNNKAMDSDPKNYSYDDVALRLSKLYMNEDFSVNDTNPDGGNENNSANTANIESIMYNTDGDDLDILFPPLDGTAMYSIACKMNHSCHPNVILLYRRRSNIGPAYPLTASVVALRNIEPHEELTISYINANASYQQRQKDLQNYGFICHCDKCEQEKDVMVDDDDEDDDSDDDSDEQDGDMDDNDDSNPTFDRGEKKLQEKMERLDSIANHSLFGRVPAYCYDPICHFIVQVTNLIIGTNNHRDLLLMSHHTPTTDPTNAAPDMTIIHLLENCVTAVKNHDYSLCKIVGCDLEATLLQQIGIVGNIHMEQIMETKAWPTIAHREAYFCSALVACIGYCHDYDFIAAKHCIDKALHLGLPQPCVNNFVQYIETFARPMQSSAS